MNICDKYKGLIFTSTSPETAVDEALEGLVMLHPGLRLLQDHRVVVREQVSLHIGVIACQEYNLNWNNFYLNICSQAEKRFFPD